MTIDIKFVNWFKKKFYFLVFLNKFTKPIYGKEVNYEI